VRTGTCQLIDRKQRETILEHIEFSYSQCADESCQLEIGRLLSASQLVVGSIGQIGGWLVVTVRLVDGPTGQTLGSVSEKYLSLEALIDALASLAQQTVQVAGRDVHAAEALTARSLVTSAGRVQLERKLQRLRRRVDEQLYARWLPEKGFAEYEQEAAIEESIEFLEEHLAQTNTWGHALDLVGSYVPFRARADEEEGRYTLAAGMLAGCTVSLSFQFDNRFAAGAFF